MSSLINNATIKVRRDTKSNWTSNNPTPNQGEWCYETDTGGVKIGDGSTAYTSLEYVVKATLPTVIDLTSANYTFNMPAITGSPQVIDLRWKNGGTYTGSLAPDADGAKVDDLDASTWTMEGDGKMCLVSSGSVLNGWMVRSYEDSSSSIDFNSYYSKQKDGTLLVYGRSPKVTTSNSQGNIFYISVSVTFLYDLYDTDVFISTGSYVGSNITWGGEAFNLTTSGMSFILCGTQNTCSGYPHYKVVGRWRA